jgi:hypothetical protein
MGTRDDYQYYKDTGQSTSGNVQNSGRNTASTPYTYSPPALVEEDQKQFQGGGYNYNAVNLARQLEAENLKKKQIEEQQRIAEEQRQKQLQWNKAEKEYNDKNRAQIDKRLAAQEKATQSQLNKSMNNTVYTYSPYGYDPTTGAPLNKSGYIYTPVTQPQSQMIVSQPDLNQQRKVYDINNYRTDKYYQDSIAQQKKDTAATYVFSQPQEQQPVNYLTPQQLALLSRNSAGGAGYNIGAELLPQQTVTPRQTINGANYKTLDQLAAASVNMKQGQVPIKPARGLGQTLQNFQYVKDSGEQQQGAVKNLGRNTQQSEGTSGEPNLPYGSKVVPSQDGKSKVILLPYKKGGYFIEDLQDLGMQPKDNWRKDQFGYDTQGQPYFEGYYYNRQDGKYYPVNFDKARYAIEKGADSAYDTWAYKGYNPDMAEYYKMFGTYYGYTPTWRTTAFANSSGAGKSGGGSYSWNTGSGSGNNTNSEQENQRRYYNDFVTWRP